MGEYQELNAAYESGQVCLFVGAGVSMGCHLPGWDELAECVLKNLPPKPHALGAMSAAIKQGRPIPPDPNALSIEKERHLKKISPLLSMRYVRSDPGNELELLVAKCLYSSRIKLSDVVREIVSLKKIRRICCFNYDDILDRAFAEEQRIYRAVFQNQRIPLESQETLIFYPHGFLPDPHRQSHKRTPKIVLSEDDYHELYGSPYAWPNIVQLILLVGYTALFIGCSLLDPNLRRLLDIVARMRSGRNHYAFFRDPFFRPNAAWYQENDSQAYRAIHKRLLSGLGIQAIWVTDYSEIAQKLREMRTDGA
jgi:hypothetical protein